MNAMMQLLQYGYLPILIGAFLAMLTCLIAGPRSWSWRLCAASLWVTGSFLFLGAAFFIKFAAETGLRQEAGGMAAFIILGASPLVLEFIGLLAIAGWRLRRTWSGSGATSPGYTRKPSCNDIPDGSTKNHSASR